MTDIFYFSSKREVIVYTFVIARSLRRAKSQVGNDKRRRRKRNYCEVRSAGEGKKDTKRNGTHDNSRICNGNYISAREFFAG